MQTRHKGRVLALQTLYAYDFNGELSQGCTVQELSALTNDEKDNIEEEAKIFAWFLINGTIEYLDHIDQIIQKFSTNRPVEAIDIIDRNILRISIYCFEHMSDIHPSIVIDEAVKLSQQFSKEVNYRFINGILDAIKKDYDKN